MRPLFWQRVRDWLIHRAMRTPFYHLPGYMDRYWLVKPSAWTLGWGVRIHKILRSDRDRHFHDHPWPSISIILYGGYTEVTPVSQDQAFKDDPFFVKVRVRRAGAVVFRRARTRHKLMLDHGCWCWSMFITGPKVRATQAEAQHLINCFTRRYGFAALPKVRSWGFAKPEGWVYWREYLNDWETITPTDDVLEEPA